MEFLIGGLQKKDITFISGLEAIHDRIDNPIFAISDENKVYLSNEKEFYSAVLSSIQSM